MIHQTEICLGLIDSAFVFFLAFTIGDIGKNHPSEETTFQHEKFPMSDGSILG